MKKRPSQTFRPSAEAIEERLLTTVLPMSPPAGVAAARFHMRGTVNAPPRVAPVRGNPSPFITFGHPRHGPGHGPGHGLGPGGGWRADSTADYMNWGVITIWNKSNAFVTYSVGASTFDNGRFHNFSLRPGGRQAFYAPFGGSFNSAPAFFVSFDTIQRSNAIQVSDINVVNEAPRWVPRVGTEGRPYAIVTMVGSFGLVSMS